MCSSRRSMKINGPIWPLGACPLKQSEQVEIFVKKTLDFERAIADADWRQSILAVADGQEASFKMDAEHFIDQFTDNYQTQLIAPEAGAEGTNQQIAAEVEIGQLHSLFWAWQYQYVGPRQPVYH